MLGNQPNKFVSPGFVAIDNSVVSITNELRSWLFGVREGSQCFFVLFFLFLL